MEKKSGGRFFAAPILKIMAIITATSRIKDERDISEQFDMSEFNDCIKHGCKPRIISFRAGKSMYTAARCPLDETDECTVFEGSRYKWNKFNPL